MSRLWRHSTLGRQRKLELFQSLILSKLLYGLAATWLNAKGQRKLDGFHNRCLRSIWGILPAYVSRTSNDTVLQLTSQRSLSTELKRQQLILYGRVARLGDGDLTRDVTFCPGTLRPAAHRYLRKVGRPRLDWTTEVGKLAVQVAGEGNLEAVVADESRWRNAVGNFLNNR